MPRWGCCWFGVVAPPEASPLAGARPFSFRREREAESCHRFDAVDARPGISSLDPKQGPL